jgi:hypothetical protein
MTMKRKMKKKWQKSEWKLTLILGKISNISRY